MDKSNIFIKSLFFSSIFFLFYIMFYHQAIGAIDSDLTSHLEIAVQFFKGDSPLVHPGFHIIIYALSAVSGLSISNSAVLILSTTVVLTSLILYKILISNLKEYYSENWILFITWVLMFVSAIYVPFFNKYIYLGQGSPSVWHNPTTIMAKPVAFLIILLTIYLFQNNNKWLNKYTFLLSILLLVSATIKPNFIIAFFPALALYWLLFYHRFPKIIGQIIAISLPVIILLSIQYIFKFGDMGNSKIIISLLDVWKLYSPNVFISFLLLTAFPLSILIFRFNRCIKNKYLVFSWIVFLIAMLQYIFFAQSGPQFSHGNFGWGRQIIIPMVFIFSIVEYMKWLKNNSETKRENIKLSISSVLLSFHLLSGILYFIKYLLTGNYC